MYTLINYDARDFLTIMEKIKAKVHDDAYKQLNRGLDHPQYYPEFIEVYARVMDTNGHGINLRDTTISSIDICPEDTKVYQNHTKSLCGEMVTIEIVFMAKYIHYHKPDIINIGDTPRTFNTYEEFLTFVTQSHRNQEHSTDEDMVSVSLFDKGTRMELFDAFRNLRKKDSTLPTLTEDEFTTLKGYRTLPEVVKGDVDKVLCPITITKEDVHLIHSRGRYKIYVDKPDFINQHLSTTEWNNAILSLLN